MSRSAALACLGKDGLSPCEAWCGGCAWLRPWGAWSLAMCAVGDSVLERAAAEEFPQDGGRGNFPGGDGLHVREELQQAEGLGMFRIL